MAPSSFWTYILSGKCELYPCVPRYTRQRHVQRVRVRGARALTHGSAACAGARLYPYHVLCVDPSVSFLLAERRSPPYVFDSGTLSSVPEPAGLVYTLLHASYLHAHILHTRLRILPPCADRTPLVVFVHSRIRVSLLLPLLSRSLSLFSLLLQPVRNLGLPLPSFYMPLTTSFSRCVSAWLRLLRGRLTCRDCVLSPHLASFSFHTYGSRKTEK